MYPVCMSVYSLCVQTLLFALRKLLNYMTPGADRRQTTEDEKVNNICHVLQWSLKYNIETCKIHTKDYTQASVQTVAKKREQAKKSIILISKVQFLI